jgi:hypothetical protein
MAPRQPFFVNFPRIDFHTEVFEHFIAERGMPILWEKATLCPCVRADAKSGTPQFNCGLCYNGNRYIDPINLTGAVTNITGQRNAQAFGDLFLGGISLTVPGDYRLGVNDRITLLQQTARYAELVEIPSVALKVDAAVGASQLLVDNTRRFPVPAAGSSITVLVAGQTLTYTGKTATTLTGIPEIGTGSIATLIPAIVGGNATMVSLLEYTLRYQPIQIFSALTESTLPLIDAIDYTIVDRRIKITASSVPARWPDGTIRFTVLYDSRPVYLVDSLAHEFRDQRLNLFDAGQLQRLPVQAVCRKDFVNRVG